MLRTRISLRAHILSNSFLPFDLNKIANRERGAGLLKRVLTMHLTPMHQAFWSEPLEVSSINTNIVS